MYLQFGFMSWCCWCLSSQDGIRAAPTQDQSPCNISVSEPVSSLDSISLTVNTSGWNCSVLLTSPDAGGDHGECRRREHQQTNDTGAGGRGEAEDKVEEVGSNYLGTNRSAGGGNETVEDVFTCVMDHLEPGTAYQLQVRSQRDEQTENVTVHTSESWICFYSNPPSSGSSAQAPQLRLLSSGSSAQAPQLLSSGSSAQGPQLRLLSSGSSAQAPQLRLLSSGSSAPQLRLLSSGSSAQAPQLRLLRLLSSGSSAQAPQLRLLRLLSSGSSALGALSCVTQSSCCFLFTRSTELAPSVAYSQSHSLINISPSNRCFPSRLKKEIKDSRFLPDPPHPSTWSHLY